MSESLLSENRDIRTLEKINEIVHCIETEIYGDAPIRLINFLGEMPDTAFYNYVRTLSVPYLFEVFEKNIQNEESAITWFSEELHNVLEHSKDLTESVAFKNLVTPREIISQEKSFKEEVKQHTGNHYGNLFKDFDHHSYFGEAKSLLEQRLERNNIRLPNLHKSRLLDQGCGGGRYTAAWKLLGVKEAVGLDYSSTGIEDAKNRVNFAGLKNIRFDKGSVLEMPYENSSFDIVFSNGVLHHTEDWEKGVEELIRVLKPGGYGWLYLTENPGGIFWDKIEILRAIMKNVDKDFARGILKSLNIPANRIFYMLDHVMVPINTRLSPDQIENVLNENGADSIQRLGRGTDFDRVEQIYHGIPYAREKFGVGENRYIFRKAE